MSFADENSSDPLIKAVKKDENVKFKSKKAGSYEKVFAEEGITESKLNDLMD